MNKEHLHKQGFIRQALFYCQCTIAGLQISAGHRTLSGQILPFGRSKLFMVGHVTGPIWLVKSPISKNCSFNAFFVNETNKDNKKAI
jgi:hypothetical protein